MGKINKKMLVFFPENPFSKRAGNVTRCKTNIEIFSKLGYTIDLVGSFDIYNDMKDELLIESNLINNHFLIKRKPKDESFLKKITFKILKKIYKKRDNIFTTPYFLYQFKKIIQLNKYDVIFVNYEFWHELLDFKELNNTQKIIDTHDWITSNEFYKNNKLNIGKKFNSELNNLNKFDKIITISHNENFIFKSFLGEKVINIPPQFKENFVTTPVSDRKYDLIFVGSDNPFNIKAIHWFLENVYPLLPIQIKICIVGRVSNNVSDYKNIEKHIFVEDLSSFYNQSKIAICPMLEGTGIKIKVVEALSYGLPIAGTLKSIDGFVASINNGCLVSNSPHEFSTSIQKLLTDSLYYGKIKNEGISFFNQNFSENIVTKIWEGVLENSSEL